MAQLSPDSLLESSSGPSLSRNLSSSRLNAEAPEFVPRGSSNSADPTQQFQMLYHPQPSVTHRNNYFYPPAVQNHPRLPVRNHRPYHHQHHHQLVQVLKQGYDGSDQVYKDGLTEEVTQKINQVEYYFSDLNLATTDHLMRLINKDPEGYVPISFVSSFKKIKTLISSDSQLASILRTSAKLVVSEDGIKIRRRLPLSESDMEELQSRIVIAENLPKDHCHQNLMRIFSAVGSVRSIRTCQPQNLNGGASSGSRAANLDGMHYSNKLHAFVEYESIELANKAVAELNEEGNWRNALKLRVMQKHTAKSAQARVKKVGNEGEVDQKESDTLPWEQLDLDGNRLEDPHQSEARSHQSHEHLGEEHIKDIEGAQKKGRSRGRGKGRGRPQYQNNDNHSHRTDHVGTAASHPINFVHPNVSKPLPGPRMPDGTRGFSMGRGKPIAINNG